MYARPLGVLAAGAALLLTAGVAGPSTALGSGKGSDGDRHASRYQRTQLLAINDFHGNLEPPSGSSGRIVVGHHYDAASGKVVDDTVDAGGVAYLATHLRQARRHHKNSITISAGDNIGASPLLSSAFYDEPTVEALNKLGVKVSAVGNHEFDQGWRELRRIQNGGCIKDGSGANNRNSCAAHTYKGAKFQYLSANVRFAKGRHRTILPPYTIKKVGDARIAFVAVVLKDTPNIVTASGVKGLQFGSEVKAVNRLVPKLKRQGVKSIVAVVHQGGFPANQPVTTPSGSTVQADPTYDYACQKGGSLVASSSPILGIAAKLSPAVDMVVSAHTHTPYVCKVKDPAGHYRLLTQASSFGRLFTDITFTYDRRTHDIVRSSEKAKNVIVTRDVKPDPAESRLVATYEKLVRPIASKVIGHVTTDVTTTPTSTGEETLGDLIADAQLADPSTVHNGVAGQVAFMNPGGIRADLTYANSPYGEAPGDITFDEAFTVQPFNDYVVSLTLTGQQIYDLLAEQVTGTNAGDHNILQVSNGFHYTLTSTGAAPGSVTINGTPISLTQSYRVVTNNFLQGGGDGFPTFTKGTDVYYGGLDIDAFSSYLQSHSPYTPPAATRIQ